MPVAANKVILKRDLISTVWNHKSDHFRHTFVLALLSFCLVCKIRKLLAHFTWHHPVYKTNTM